MKNKDDEKIGILIIYFLFILGYIFSRGFYAFSSLVFLLIVLIITTKYFFRGKIIFFNNSSLKLVDLQRFVLFLSLFFSLLLYGGIYQEKNYLTVISLFILATLLCLTVFDKNYLKKIVIFFIGFAILGVIMIKTSPLPQIDIFYFLKEGAWGFVHGQNPYSMIFTRINNYSFYLNGKADFYSYFPGMIFLTLPGVVLLNDPRFSMLLAVLLSAYFIYRKFNQPELSLIFLFNPLSMFILEQSWTESIIILLLVLIVYLFSVKRFFMVAIIYGLMLATKQYAFLFLPFIWQMMTGNRKKLVHSVIICLAILLPFIFWSWRDFLNDSVLLQFMFPARYDGLTLTSFLFREFNISLPWILPFIIWIIAFTLLYFRQHYWTSHRILLANFIFLYVFLILNKWSFVNYYYLLSSFLILAIALNERPIGFNNEK